MVRMESVYEITIFGLKILCEQLDKCSNKDLLMKTLVDIMKNLTAFVRNSSVIYYKLYIQHIYLSLF
jgi:hypothetical protein